MPAPQKPDKATEHTTRSVATLKWKVSNASKAQLPQKKMKGLTGDIVSLSDTSSDKSNDPSIIDSSTIQKDTEKHKGADIELGMSPFNS
jgi:hypothetical protein